MTNAIEFTRMFNYYNRDMAAVTLYVQTSAFPLSFCSNIIRVDHSTAFQWTLRVEMWKICPNNFENNDEAKELSIIPEF